jgi:AraC family transcriptional regulator of adaptative response / DNA-3-methyladenine glycosylase II
MPTFQLPYHPPYDWAGTLDFLKGRSIQDVELVTADSYARTFAIGGHTGEIKITHLPDHHSLRVDCSPSLAKVLPELTRRVTNLFDLEADPVKINAHLALYPLFTESITRTPGLRVPGAFDGFEMAIRSILGQQITVRAATTLSSRFALAFGEEVTASSSAGLSRITPPPEKIATLEESEIARLGIIGARARSIIHIARAFSNGQLALHPGMDPDATMARLVELPGIGPWTAGYLVMRGLNHRDAFPRGDIALQKALGGITAKQADQLSQPWRPYRSYTVLHLWRMLATSPRPEKKSKQPPR